MTAGFGSGAGGGGAATGFLNKPNAIGLSEGQSGLALAGAILAATREVVVND
jgi:hypothetical protein